MNYSSPGLGTTPQLSCELLRVRAGIAMQHIPYNSGPQAIQALLTNLVQLFCSAMPLVQPHIDAGKLKPLAVTSATRWRGLPDVPTMQEAGFDDFVTDTMVMLAGPARLPTEITAKVSHVMQAILTQPAVRQVLATGRVRYRREAARRSCRPHRQGGPDVAEHRDGHRPQARVDAHGDSRQDDEREREALPMFYEPAKNNHGLRFAPFKSCIVPRPIAWVSTVNAKGVINLSPFSQNNILGWDPPYVMFSAFTRFDGRRKDSVSNAEETGEFVFNMATYALRDAVVLTSAIEEAWRRRDGASRADARTIATGKAPARRRVPDKP